MRRAARTCQAAPALAARCSFWAARSFLRFPGWFPGPGALWGPIKCTVAVEAPVETLRCRSVGSLCSCKRTREPRGHCAHGVGAQGGRGGVLKAGEGAEVAPGYILRRSRAPAAPQTPPHSCSCRARWGWAFGDAHLVGSKERVSPWRGRRPARSSEGPVLRRSP